MEFKSGVKIFGMRPELMAGMMVCDRVVKNAGFAFVVTSVTDGKHSRASLHYAGQAFDFRTRDMSQGQQEQVHAECKKRLSDEFDVVLETDHIHVEFQPKG